MATTYQLIEAKTLTSTTASIIFSAIPQTYTDLIFVTSCRSDGATQATGGLVNFNGSGTGFSTVSGYGSGTGIGYFKATNEFGSLPGSSPTASTFSNSEVYLPNYTSGVHKHYSIHTVTENAGNEAYAYFFGGRWADTAAITSITYTPAAGSFISGSTFYLYGIKNA